MTNHLSKKDSPVQIWNTLHRTFAETGEGLHLQAVMMLSDTYRVHCNSNEEYIGRMMEAWRRCEEVGIVFEGHIVARFTVGNLGPNFDSFRQSLVASGQKATMDRVKAALLGLTPAKSGNAETALYGGNAETAYYGGPPRGGTTKRLGSSGPSRKLARIKCFGWDILEISSALFVLYTHMVFMGFLPAGKSTKDKSR